jgi:hypothetical protein
MVEYIEEIYPKGNEDRGKAGVIITLFICWLSKNKKL